MVLLLAVKFGGGKKSCSSTKIYPDMAIEGLAR